MKEEYVYKITYRPNMSSLEIQKNGFVDLLFCNFADEHRYDEKQLVKNVQRAGLTLDSWMTVLDPFWSGIHAVYYGYLVWKSTTGQYGYVCFHYLPKEDEGRKHRVFEFVGPYSKDELIEIFTRSEKSYRHVGLVSSLTIFESDVSN